MNLLNNLNLPLLQFTIKLILILFIFSNINYF
uniref:Uncharacterized protein n=1 Tax=viral metagenome TaxID=1070528 RepID=A0A6C0ED31_9ZZZZ